MKNPEISEYKRILAVMPLKVPLTAAQVGKRVAISGRQAASMLSELRRYGVVKVGVDGYVKLRELNPRKHSKRRSRNPKQSLTPILAIHVLAGLGGLIYWLSRRQS